MNAKRANKKKTRAFGMVAKRSSSRVRQLTRICFSECRRLALNHGLVWLHQIDDGKANVAVIIVVSARLFSRRFFLLKHRFENHATFSNCNSKEPFTLFDSREREKIDNKFAVAQKVVLLFFFLFSCQRQ